MGRPYKRREAPRAAGRLLFKPVEKFAKCELDFPETYLTLRPHTKSTHTFRYKAGLGEQAADEFGMYFYSEPPMQQLDSPDRVQNNLPIVVFKPTTPVIHDGAWHTASFTIQTGNLNGALYALLFLRKRLTQ